MFELLVTINDNSSSILCRYSHNSTLPVEITGCLSLPRYTHSNKECSQFEILKGITLKHRVVFDWLSYLARNTITMLDDNPTVRFFIDEQTKLIKPFFDNSMTP